MNRRESLKTAILAIASPLVFCEEAKPNKIPLKHLPNYGIVTEVVITCVASVPLEFDRGKLTVCKYDDIFNVNITTTEYVIHYSMKNPPYGDLALDWMYNIKIKNIRLTRDMIPTNDKLLGLTIRKSHPNIVGPNES
jgi:hypothetical protein